MDKTQQNRLKPFLKWAGGKSKLINQYQEYLPKTFDRYFEPFLGGGALFFHLRGLCGIDPLRTQQWYLSDTNADLVLTYRCVRDRVEELITRLEEHQENHSKEYYYAQRFLCCAKHSPEGDIDRAARFIYLNKTCFNGLYRVNRKGEFNVPIGNYRNPLICQADLLREVSLALRAVEIKEVDYSYVLDYAQTSRDFVYYDPPYYPVSQTSSFTSYTSGGFSLQHHLELKYHLVELTRRGVLVLLSNSDCDFTRHLFSDFKIHQVLCSRSINSESTKRGVVSEILVSNF